MKLKKSYVKVFGESNCKSNSLQNNGFCEWDENSCKLLNCGNITSSELCKGTSSHICEWDDDKKLCKNLPPPPTYNPTTSTNNPTTTSTNNPTTTSTNNPTTTSTNNPS